MAEPTNLDDLGEDQEILDKPEEAIEQEDLPSELPSDPEALKQLLLEREEKLKEATRKAKETRRENERLAERAKEQETKATYWAKEAQRKQVVTSTSDPSTPTKPVTAQSTSSDVKSALKGIDLAEYVTEKDGLARLVSDLEEKGVIVTQSRLDKILDERVTREQQQQARMNSQYRQVVSKYPDLQDPESELARAAATIFERLTEESPEMDEAARFRLAAAEAAADINYKPSSTSKPSTTSTQNGNRDRLRKAQGGPTTTGTITQKPAVVTEQLKKMALKTAQGELSEDALKRVAARVAAQQSQSQQARK